MSDAAFVPDWTRPVRIPESVPIEHAEPPTVVAGETCRPILRFRLSRAIPPGTTLLLQLHGGRNVKGRLAPPSGADTTLTPAPGLAVTVRPTETDGTFELAVGAEGLEEGELIDLTLGDDAGVRAPEISQRDKPFILYAPDLLDDPSVWDLSETLLRGTGESDHVVRQAGSVWSDEAQQAMVGACTMHILGGAVDHLRAYAPSQVRPGEPFSVLVRPEDARCNLSPDALRGVRAFLADQPLSAEAEPVADSTCVKLTLRLDDEGVHRLRITDADRRDALTNPVLCRAADGPHNVYWGVIHGHTELSDGTGSIDNYFRQMRDEAGLDFGAPGDHDHLGETPDRLWHITCDAVARWNEPGRFATLLGYEWAKWRQDGDGDRNVYYLDDQRPMYRSDEDHCPHPPDLFRAIRDETAIVIPHHTGHFGNFCDFKDHDPVHERLIEIFQLRGSYERPDDNPVPEHCDQPTKSCGYVSRALAMGWRVGFTAGGDDHVGHAGTDFPVPAGETRYKAGLMAVLAADRTRQAVWDAMWNRRVVATTGPRILLDYELNGNPLGSELAATNELLGRRELRITFHGTAPAARIDVIRNNDIVHTVTPDEQDCELEWVDETPLGRVLLPPAEFCDHPFCFYYVRAVQADGEVAWASPVWLDAEE